MTEDINGWSASGNLSKYHRIHTYAAYILRIIKKASSNDIPTIFPWTNATTIRKSPANRPFTPPEPKKRKHEDNLSEQLQEHAKSVTELQLEYSKLEEELQTITRELESIKLSHVERFGVHRFEGNDDDIRFYTSLPSYDILLCLYRYLEPLLPYLRYRPSKHKQPTRQRLLQPIDELFMELVRLRLNLLEKDLSHRFNCSLSTASRICTAWLPFLSTQLYPLITWPSRELINHHMPIQFRDVYPSTRVIIDCTELFIETPPSLNIQSSTWSSYKHHNTFKGLIGISPTGACIFVSSLYTGGISDKEITRCSGILDLVEPGDSVMADKGFDISYELLTRGCKLNMPPFIKQYHILSTVIPLSISPFVNNIWFICCALSLFHPPLVVDIDKLSDAELARIKLIVDSELKS